MKLEDIHKLSLNDIYAIIEEKNRLFPNYFNNKRSEISNKISYFDILLKKINIDFANLPLKIVIENIDLGSDYVKLLEQKTKNQIDSILFEQKYDEIIRKVKKLLC